MQTCARATLLIFLGSIQTFWSKLGYGRFQTRIRMSHHLIVPKVVRLAIATHVKQPAAGVIGTSTERLQQFSENPRKEKGAGNNKGKR